MKNHFLLFALAAAFTVTSCGKNDDSVPVPAETTIDPANDPAAIKLSSQLLTDHDWKLTAFTQSVPAQNIYNDIYTNNMPACQRDDVYTFGASNTVKVDPGFLTCSTSEQDKTGTWVLKNAKTLTVNIPGLPQAGQTGEFTIEVLENNKMILKQILNGSEYVVTYEKYAALSKTQLLTASPWKLNSIILEMPGYPPSDLTPTTSCEKDNLTQFDPDGTFEMTEGATRCNPSDPQVISSGNWQFLNNETRIFFEGDELEIVQLTPAKMVLKYNDSGLVVTNTYSK